MFAKFTGNGLCQILCFNKVAFLRLWKKRLWHKFSCEFSKISKNAFFTVHLRTTASVFSFSEAATRGVLWKKEFLKISKNSQENTFDLGIFQKHLFYRTPLDDYFWLFRPTLLKWSTANSVWETLDEYSLSRNTNLGSTVQVYHFFFWQGKPSVYVFIGLHCLLQEAAIRVEVFCKKRWITFQTWHLFEEHLPTTAFALHSHHSLLRIRFT